MKFLAASSVALLLANQVAAYVFIEGCLQNHTIVANDSCTSVAATYKLTEAEFYAMNPGLHHSVAHMCDNLDDGKNYCVCLKAPCPVPNAAVATAVPVSNAAASAPAAASAVASSTVETAATPAAANKDKSSTVSAAAPAATTSSSAATTNKAFGAIALGLVMAAASALF